MNTTTAQRAGCGASNTSALAFGGYTGSPASFRNETESWNGTNWTEVNNLNTARASLSGNGIITAALAAGGEVPGDNSNATESWNGTNWTTLANMNDKSREGAMIGTYTAAIQAGGNVGSSNTATAEDWNGVSWQEVADLNTGRYQLNNGQSGSSTSGVVFGGKASYGPPPAVTGSTEEWSVPSNVIKVLTD